LISDKILFCRRRWNLVGGEGGRQLRAINKRYQKFRQGRWRCLLQNKQKNNSSQKNTSGFKFGLFGRFVNDFCTKTSYSKRRYKSPDLEFVLTLKNGEFLLS